MLIATAFNDPKNLLSTVDNIYGKTEDTRHDPHEESDYAEWSWQPSEVPSG